MLGDVSDFVYGPAFDAVDIGIIVLDEQQRIVERHDAFFCRTFTRC